VESEDIQAIAKKEIETDAHGYTQEDMSDMQEKNLFNITSSIINPDYHTLLEGDLKLFTQELKTANIDTQDQRFCNQAFQVIFMWTSYCKRNSIGFKLVYDKKSMEIMYIPDQSVDPAGSEFVQQLLKEISARLALSNSKSGHLIDLIYKNISEKRYSYNDGGSGIGKFLRRR